MSKHTNIYALYDPRKLVDGEIENIRYIGKSDKPLERLQRHIRYSRKGTNYSVCDWIRKLLREDVAPQMLILCRVSMKYWQGMEQHIIDVMREEGHDLLNFAEGGEGFTSEEMKRMHADPEVRANMSAAQKHRYEDPAEIAKMSAAQKRRYKDPAERAKTSAIMKRHYEDPVARAKQSVVQKRRYKDPAERVKMSAAQNRPEVKAKHSASMKELWADSNHRAKRKIRRLRRKVMKFMLRRYGA